MNLIILKFFAFSHYNKTNNVKNYLILYLLIILMNLWKSVIYT
jgi:hypothetical protein